MGTELITEALEKRYASLPADDVNVFDMVLTNTREWLSELIDLPPKEVVLQATKDALERVFAGVDTPGPDVLVEPPIILMLVGLVGYAYDAIAKETA